MHINTWKIRSAATKAATTTTKESIHRHHAKVPKFSRKRAFSGYNCIRYSGTIFIATAAISAANSIKSAAAIKRIYHSFFKISSSNNKSSKVQASKLLRGH
jgi:hypothetical protein